jgi:Protein of unknown function (DUF3443)
MRPAFNISAVKRSALLRGLRHGCAAAMCLAAISCGGGSTLYVPPPPVITPGSNVVGVVVGPGPTGNSINALYTTVTVCVPGSATQCQTIDNILVDTGSYGLRLLAPPLTLNLGILAAPDGNALLECTVFVDGFSWGPVAAADINIAGESASSVPVQIIGDSRYTAVPSDCSGTGGTEENTVALFGANGVLGIGAFAQDCPDCAANLITAFYYSCSSGTNCVNTLVPLTSQVQNPVPLFPVDNNGTIITLPAVPSGGAAGATGSLIFGIDTQSNNQSGTPTVLALQTSGPNVSGVTTIYNGQTLSASFIDSGSNALYFNDSNIAPCLSSSFTGFYCPATTGTYGATIQGANGVSAAVTFEVGDAETLPQSVTAFAGLAGTTTVAGSFDWGLPFFYGNRVATAIAGYSTSAGTGPYVAF